FIQKSGSIVPIVKGEDVLIALAKRRLNVLLESCSKSLKHFQITPEKPTHAGMETSVLPFFLGLPPIELIWQLHRHPVLIEPQDLPPDLGHKLVTQEEARQGAAILAAKLWQIDNQVANFPDDLPSAGLHHKALEFDLDPGKCEDLPAAVDV